ncbi:SGNH/GDSL hydrolase family protein [Haloferula sp. A504]|uniref:SGNH/GDSL hydrolase family protein n=1 Tax=Haloferula sp. A504 TaxID=3373601 RepID=UPI0031C1085E|nr:SGNH/GDSL hydrolase family protein [Verrucomicrobiaceae bacterium E54]
MNRRSLLITGASLLGGAPTAMAAVSATAAEGPSLPAFTPGTRLLFQGDSITDMKWGRNQKDRNHYLGHSYVFLLAARLGVDMASIPLDFLNRGHSGNTVADLRKRWRQDAVDLNPDVLSVLIGTNDVASGVQADAYEADYRHLLETSREANPDLKLVLLDPFVLQSGPLSEEGVWKTRREATDALRKVVARLARDFNAVHVKTQQVFDAAAKEVPPDHWIWDGIHPLPQGHELIARQWLHEVSRRWPKE